MAQLLKRVETFSDTIDEEEVKNDTWKMIVVIVGIILILLIAYLAFGR